MQARNEIIKQQLQEAQVMSVKYAEKVTDLEQELKVSLSLSNAFSFSRFSKEEFKEIAFKIRDDHMKLLVELFEGLNEI